MESPVISVAYQPYRLRFRRPFATASITHAVREGYLVRLTTRDGAFGLGEAAPLPGHGGEPLDAVLPALRALAGALREAIGDVNGGNGSPETPDVWRAVMSRLRALAPDAPAACAAVDLALADLAARRAGLPLARWLSPDARGSVELNATIGADDPDITAEQARAAVAAGYRTLKLKVLGDDDRADLARVARVRDVVGDGVRLRLDVNGAWDEVHALIMLPVMSIHGLEYVEQPVPARDAAVDIPSLARVRAASPVPIAADEVLLLPGGLAAVIATRAADVLILKPALMGGLARVWDIAVDLQGKTEAEDLPSATGEDDAPDIVITTSLDSAIGRLGALHLAAALPGLTRACGLATGGLLAEDVAATPEVRRGEMVLAAAPGLGVVVEGRWLEV